MAMNTATVKADNEPTGDEDELPGASIFTSNTQTDNTDSATVFVDCPAILFPFMRRVLADVVRDGGFPPLMLDPIDFGRLYAQNLAKGEPMGEAQAKN